MKMHIQLFDLEKCTQCQVIATNESNQNEDKMPLTISV